MNEKQLNVNAGSAVKVEDNNDMEITTDKGDIDAYTGKKTVFYDLYADLTLRFKDGGALQVNKGILAFHSNIFSKLFLGLPPKSEVTIDDFDCETFQTFLDCFIGLKPYTVIDSLLIYPIAHKYQVQKCLKKCINVLKPTEMSDNVLLTLNLALFYECNELVESVVNFLKDKVNIAKLIEDENCNQLLEPAAMLKLIKHVKLDSFFWKKIYEWGEKYLIKYGRDMNVRKFFDESKIFSCLSLYHFESVQSILDFHESVTKKKFLIPDEIFLHLNNCYVEGTRNLRKKSEWMFMRKGDSIEETIKFKQPLSLSKSAFPSFGEGLLICWNNILCYHNHTGEKNNNIIQIEVGYKYKDQKPDSPEYNNAQDENRNFKKIITINDIKLENDYIITKLEKPKFILEISSVHCTYKFLGDCRILKQPLDEILVNAEDRTSLYFTDYVTF